MRREAVGVAGLIAYFSITVLPSFTIRPNRVAEGVAGHVLEYSRAGLLPLVIAVLAVGVVLAACAAFGPLRRLARVRLVLAAVPLPLLVAVLLVGSQAALASGAPESGRVAPAAGWWFAAIGAYLVFYDARRRFGTGAPGGSATLARATAAAMLLATASLPVVLPTDGLGIVQEYSNRAGRFWGEFRAHVGLSGASVAGSVMLGVPLGLLAFRSRRADKPVLAITSGLQTIPSLALFGLMIAPLAFVSRQVPALRELGVRGVGNAPAVIALTLYGLLPVVRNTYVGMTSVDEGVLEAGRGMGMSRRELLVMVRAPIALPIVLTGVRITAVQTVGNAAVAALIGARGLGNFVFQGLGQASSDLIVLGALPIVALAVAVDRGMDALISALRPGPRTAGEVSR